LNKRQGGREKRRTRGRQRDRNEMKLVFLLSLVFKASFGSLNGREGEGFGGRG